MLPGPRLLKDSGQGVSTSNSNNSKRMYQTYEYSTPELLDGSTCYRIVLLKISQGYHNSCPSQSRRPKPVLIVVWPEAYVR